MIQVTELLESSDITLFKAALKNPDHVIHPLHKATGYNLRKRSHGLLLPTTQSNLLRKNFVYIVCYLKTFISYYMFYSLRVAEPLRYDSVLFEETNEWMRPCHIVNTAVNQKSNSEFYLFQTKNAHTRLQQIFRRDRRRCTQLNVSNRQHRACLNTADHRRWTVQVGVRIRVRVQVRVRWSVVICSVQADPVLDVDAERGELASDVSSEQI